MSTRHPDKRGISGSTEGANVLQNTKQYKNAFEYDAYRPLQWSYLRGGDVYPGEVSGREGCPGVSTPLDPVTDTTL